MELLATRIGSILHYDQPYSPTQKAKIERWFRTIKDQWMAALDIRDFHSLDELRGNLFAYVPSYSQSPHSSLKGRTPQDRFFSEPNLFHRLSEEEMEHISVKKSIYAEVMNHDGLLHKICSGMQSVYKEFKRNPC